MIERVKDNDEEGVDQSEIKEALLSMLADDLCVLFCALLEIFRVVGAEFDALQSLDLSREFHHLLEQGRKVPNFRTHANQDTPMRKVSF